MWLMMASDGDTMMAVFFLLRKACARERRCKMLASLSARWWHNDDSLSLVAEGVHTREEMLDDGSAVGQMVAQQW
jgi:hypothetical protein